MDLIAIETSIIKFLKNNILAENVELNNTTILRDIGVDSYSIVEIVLFIERQYGFVIPDNQLKPENFENVKTVSEIVFHHLSNN